MFPIGKALEFPGSLRPLNLDLEGVGGQTFPVLIVLHLASKILDGPGEAEVRVLPEVYIKISASVFFLSFIPGSSVAPSCGFHRRLLDLT